MLLIAVVPIASSFLFFERISEFNQDLQTEALESIESVSGIYRAYVKSESSRIDLIQRNIYLEVDDLLQKHQITRAIELRQSEDFKNELQNLFNQFIQNYDLIMDIRLSLNMEPIVQAEHRPDFIDKYKMQAVAIPVAIRSRYGNAQTGSSIPDSSSEIPMLVAEPLIESDIENRDYIDASDTKYTLPENIVDASGFAPSSAMGVQLIVMFAIDRAQSDKYEKLGENINLHSTISAMEADDAPGVTDIYNILFVGVSLLVILLAFGFALFIAFPLSRRVSSLTRATERVADGDLSTKIEIKGNDQVAFLMTQFNGMVDQIRAAQESKAYIERMQAWQEVARRLAHEIKNPLTPIVLAVQQLDGKFDDYVERPQKYRKLLNNVVEIVNEETETLRKLVKNFSEFARMPVPEMKETCFAEFVSQTVEQNPQFAEQSSRITVHPCDSNVAKTLINIDHELMRRVIVNIVRNGIEAAHNAHFDPEIDIQVKQAPADDERHKVCLSIIDNGPGLTDEQKSKLFMPYFTTKTDGTGLGLAIVRKIIEDHCGHIQLHDRDDGNRGTQADIVL